ncbi:BA75_02509T0 [Komagataella pastoris]|uniref:BA75_02509T0 n=1 Tax=Komagataella pastoris TaxID=4922 RepID=A0A1B2JB11_PICPA|nr:BA75_02509T0 [Komagataella pastoris]
MSETPVPKSSQDFTKDDSTEAFTKYEGSDLLEEQSVKVGVVTQELNRALQPRHVSLIAIAGIIGTGLFLSSSRSLAQSGPLSLLLCNMLIGLVVYLTMLSLGEMSTFIPQSGSFCTYAKRWVSESFGFAIICNYWFNDAVSVASDLTALQLLMAYWTDFHYWVVSLIFWFFLLSLNVIHVRFYGEAEYWMAILKVATIIAFFIVSIVVNAGHNTMNEYIGFRYWSQGDAPFVDGFKGFCKCFVFVSFSFGGTESIAITAGEQVNPTRTMPRVIKTTFYRIIIFYVFSAFFIGMNVPYDYPNLSTKSTATSPFTIVFQMAGSKSAGSFMNAVIVTSVISAGNHALFAGSRLAYTMGTEGYFPKIFTRTNRYQVPYVGVLLTWFIGGACFGSSFIGAGTLWTWLQSLVGVSNQISWLCIAITSIRFRRGLEAQGRTNELTFKNWTYPYGPWFCVGFITLIILVQGWGSFDPWDVAEFFQNYIQLLIFPTCFAAWYLYKRDRFTRRPEMDFDTDRYHETEKDLLLNKAEDEAKGFGKVVFYIKNYII